MEHRQLGASGLMVPVLSLGTGTFGGGDSEFFKAWGASDATYATRLVDICLEAGLTMFDSANIYSGGQSEEILGVAIKGRRDRVLISTKGTFRAGAGTNDVGSSRHHLIRAVEASLRRLGTNHIDLYQVHRWDPDVPIDETLAALDDLVHGGKVRYIGCSGYASYQLYRALWSSELHDLTRPISLQVPYSLLSAQAEQELLPACAAEGVGVLAFSVVAAGLLSGRYAPESEPAATTRLGSRQVFRDRYWRPETFQLLDRLHDLSRETGRSVAQLATGAVLCHPAVSAVVYGVSDPDQLADPVEAAEHPLSDDELRAVRGARPR